MEPSLRYLIVEDDPNLRLLWRSVLTGQGYAVEEANSLEAAQVALEAGGFDAMILDLYLGRENGLSLATLAAEQPEPCRVIIVTGAAQISEAKIRAAAPTVISVHRKPVDIEDLMAVCAQLEEGMARRATS